MSRRRRRQFISVSLFSFQDIIAAVTGIILVIALLLTVELLLRTPSEASHPPPTSEMGALHQAISECREETSRLKARSARYRNRIRDMKKHIPISVDDIEELEDAVRTAQQNLDKVTAEEQSIKEQRRQRDKSIAAAQAKKAKLEKQRTELEEQNTRNSKKVKVELVQGDASSKRPFIVVCAADGIVVGTLTKEDGTEGFLTELQRFEGRRFEIAFARWIEEARNPNTEYFVLMVRRGAIHLYYRVERMLTQERYEVGTDVLPDEVTLFDKADR